MTLVRAKAVVEMLGGPKEHIQQVLVDFVELKLKKPPSPYTVLSCQYAEPTPAGKLFSTFAELDIEFKKIDHLLDFCFEAMPSSIEIYSPDILDFSLPTLNTLVNDLASRIHHTDVLLKDLRSQNSLINKNAIELLRNFVRYLIKHGQTSLSTLSSDLGLTEKELEPFLNRMIEDNQLRHTSGTYLLP